MTRAGIAAVAFGAALLVATSVAALGAGEEKRLSETQKIEALIRTVAELKDATFVRNGQDYDGKAAADHMRRKWKRQEKEIQTAKDFIRLAGTKSYETGKVYVIRFKDGKEVESGKWLGEKLETMEGEPGVGRK
jgi:hypothetical protein